MLTDAVLGLLMLVAITEFLIGLIGNGILAVWSFGEWARKFKRSSYNLIVLGLAVCRFLLQWMIMIDLSLFPFIQDRHWLQYLNISWVLISQASLWFATFLSVFYCRRIATFEHPVCLWLKQRANCLSLWCFMGYLLISLFLVTHISLKYSSPSLGNSSFLYPLSNAHYLSILRLNSGCWLPFLVFLVSSGMLIISLYRHHKKMQVHIADRRDARAKAHITVLKSLGCFLILHVVYILASPLSITSKSSANLSTVFISKTLMAAYPSLHSVILIMGNARIKQICQRILWKTISAWRS
ncbi:taste receptor type 2 member 5 [Erinaceus europaeus]|uniref:Taste receptor type 2 n=1 Tax=Erinaceus europaeus TaxID=9365 RepID=A0ABM3XSC6_ERIEU|nr:taste receptor type 2 member 5 [Erinaceus europaeus]